MADITLEHSITKEFTLFATATSTDREWSFMAYNTAIEIGITDNATAPSADKYHVLVEPGGPPVAVKVKANDRVWVRKFRGDGQNSQKFVTFRAA